ncbi:MAG: CAP domain-containing protein [Bacteroidota bacterium]|nr:CAP domain-containing protein [Bacteroidota bacterium]
MKRILPTVFLLTLPLFLFTFAGDEDEIAKKKAADDYRKSFVATEITAPEQLGWSGKESSCKPGHLSRQAYVNMLTRINYYRRLAGVYDHVTLDSAWCKYAQAAAVIMNANNQLNHNPDASMKCYSADGKLGASTSNLSTIVDKSIRLIIADEIQDGSAANNDCGHRRWLLNSKSYKIGVGATPGAYAVRVMESFDEAKDTSSFHGIVPEYFGYPFRGFIPCQVVYPKWSFAVPGGADFTVATVEVKSGDKIFPCTIVSRGKKNYGDPTIVWTMKGLKEDYDYSYYDMSEKKKGFETLGMLNKKITVKVSNVKVDGKVKSYSYSFTIFDPDEVSEN